MGKPGKVLALEIDAIWRMLIKLFIDVTQKQAGKAVAPSPEVGRGRIRGLEFSEVIKGSARASLGLLILPIICPKLEGVL